MRNEFFTMLLNSRADFAAAVPNDAATTAMGDGPRPPPVPLVEHERALSRGLRNRIDEFFHLAACAPAAQPIEESCEAEGDAEEDAKERHGVTLEQDRRPKGKTTTRRRRPLIEEITDDDDAKVPRKSQRGSHITPSTRSRKLGGAPSQAGPLHGGSDAGSASERATDDVTIEMKLILGVFEPQPPTASAAAPLISTIHTTLLRGGERATEEIGTQGPDLRRAGLPIVEEACDTASSRQQPPPLRKIRNTSLLLPGEDNERLLAERNAAEARSLANLVNYFLPHQGTDKRSSSRAEEECSNSDDDAVSSATSSSVDIMDYTDDDDPVDES